VQHTPKQTKYAESLLSRPGSSKKKCGWSSGGVVGTALCHAEEEDEAMAL
jgi:hypothetical protein